MGTAAGGLNGAKAKMREHAGDGARPGFLPDP